MAGHGSQTATDKIDIIRIGVESEPLGTNTMNMIAIDWKIAMLAPNCQMRPGRALAGALLKAHPEARSAGAIRTRVAQLDPDALGPALTAFVMVEALEHTAEWRTGSRTTTRTTRTQG